MTECFENLYSDATYFFIGGHPQPWTHGYWWFGQPEHRTRVFPNTYTLYTRPP